MTARALVIGLGNLLRRDDGVGRRVVRALPGDVERRELPGAGAELASLLAEAARDGRELIVVDAIRAGAAPGTVRTLDARAGKLPLAFASSTHALGLAEAIELARAMNQLPPRLIVVGVEAGDLQTGEGLSGAVEAAIGEAVAAVVAALEGKPVMHEISLFKGLLKQIERLAAAQGAKRVVAVRIRLGALANISPSHFREHFEELVPGTIAEGAELEVWQLDDMRDPRAQEIILESIDVDD